MITIKEFTSDWCGVCKSIKPVVKTIMEQHKDSVVFEEVNITNDTTYAKELNITHLPTFVFFDNDGNEVFRHTGPIPPAEFKNKISEFNK